MNGMMKAIAAAMVGVFAATVPLAAYADSRGGFGQLPRAVERGDGDRGDRGDRDGGRDWRDHDGRRHGDWERREWRDHRPHGHDGRWYYAPPRRVYYPVPYYAGTPWRSAPRHVSHRGVPEIAVIGGTLIGALIGYGIGRSTVSRADEARASDVLERNRSGERSTWVNPDNQSEVTVTPIRTYQNSSEEYCREYTTEVRVGGEVRSAYGTACRQPDGSWRIVK